MKNWAVDFEQVRDVMNKVPLHSLKLKWSWRWFTWIYVYEYDNIGLMRYYQQQIQVNWLKIQSAIARSRPNYTDPNELDNVLRNKFIEEAKEKYGLR